MRLFVFALVFMVILGVQAGCPSGTLTSPSDSTVCYSFTASKASYYKATIDCYTNFGGDLASISDAGVNTFLALQGYNLLPPASKFWLDGMYRSKWLWTDGTVFGYQNWGSRKDLDGYCISMAAGNGLWYAVNCTVAKASVCKFTLSNSTVTSTTTVLASTTTTTTRAPTTTTTVLPTTTTRLPTTTTTTHAPLPSTTPLALSCSISLQNLFFTYFIDVGTSSTPQITWYQTMMDLTTAHEIYGTGTLQLYAANGDGKSTSRKPLNALQLGYDLMTLMTEVYGTNQASLAPALTNYQSSFPAQLTYSATPIVVIYLINPITDIPAAATKMAQLQGAVPKTYFIGVLIGTVSPGALTFDYTIQVNSLANATTQSTVTTIFNFACTVSH